MLLTRDIIKCVFFHSEEIGCVGSRDADMEWFKDVGYCFQGDRNGHGDFVNNISGKLFSKNFSKRIAPILKHHGYKETSGAITDVGQLAENGIGVCVANMSCGYYSPHSDEEVVIFEDSNNCLTMIDRLIDELGNNKYEFQFTSSYGNFNFKWQDKDDKYGDFADAKRSYWYGDYGTATQEVVISEDTGEPSCYYCGCEQLLQSQYGNDYRFCPDCVSDIFCSETEGDTKTWNESFGIKEIDYEDISDNYDGSMKHKSIVNEYLINHKKNK